MISLAPDVTRHSPILEWMRNHEESAWVTAAGTLLPVIGHAINYVAFDLFNQLGEAVENAREPLDDRSKFFTKIKILELKNKALCASAFNSLWTTVFWIFLVTFKILTHPVWMWLAIGYGTLSMIAVTYVDYIASNNNAEIRNSWASFSRNHFLSSSHSERFEKMKLLEIFPLPSSSEVDARDA